MRKQVVDRYLQVWPSERKSCSAYFVSRTTWVQRLPLVGAQNLQPWPSSASVHLGKSFRQQFSASGLSARITHYSTRHLSEDLPLPAARCGARREDHRTHGPTSAGAALTDPCKPTARSRHSSYWGRSRPSHDSYRPSLRVSLPCPSSMPPLHGWDPRHSYRFEDSRWAKSSI